jgi:hypothetical protein
VIANHLYYEIDRYGIIPLTQFACCHHSAINAATTLHYKAVEAMSAGQVGLVILFDISGFFNSLDPDVILVTLSHLGINLTTRVRTCTMMTGHSVSLSFNSKTSNPYHPKVGTPLSEW